MLFVKELARRLKVGRGWNMTANAVHPGPVATGLFRNIPYLGVVIKYLADILCYSSEVRSLELNLNEVLVFGLARISFKL